MAPPRTLLTRKQLLRALAIMAVVGTWLTLFNQYEALSGGALDAALALKILLNYATPFTVTTVFAVWGNLRPEAEEGARLDRGESTVPPRGR
jgi:hypothetical protein